MYLAASNESISDVLLAERDKKRGPDLFRAYEDEASSAGGLGACLMLVSPKGKEFTYALCFEFETTNNEAEYEALLTGLKIAADMGIKDLPIFVDTQLVTNKVKGLFEARQPVIKQYPKKTKEVLEGFITYTMELVHMNQNKKADALRKLASITLTHLTKEVILEVLTERSITHKEVSDIIVEKGEN
ncbi:reverse transcriptase domain-containing protein [Tanacetum coccineum]